MRQVSAALCAAALMISPGLGIADDGQLTLDQVLARAREHAPAVGAARATVDEARGHLLGASVLLRDNPEVETGAGPRLAGDHELLEATVGVRQTFELGSRRAARIAGAQAGIDRASAYGADTMRRVLRDAALAFFTVLYDRERLKVMEEAAVMAAETATIAERRHGVGDIGVLDLHIAQAVSARARAAVQAQAAAVAAALGTLRIAIGMPGDEPLDVQGNLGTRDRYGLDDLLSRAIERTDVQVLAAEVREARADRRLGDGLQWPEVGLGAHYERDDGDNVAMGRVTFTLPVFERGQGQRAEALAREHRAQQAIDASRRTIDVEVRTAYTVYRRCEDAVAELERDTMPGIDANEVLVRRSYAAGQLSLGELLAMRRELIETKGDYLTRRFEAAVAGVELAASAGVLQ